MSSKEKNKRLSLALRKNLKKRKIFQKKNNEDKVLDASKPITLDFLTNPNKE